MSSSERTVRIGTSGWSYDHWDGVLYPPGLPVRKRLARYVEVFDTVELNASFYRWPRDATFEGWRTRLPQGFTMSVKAHRGLSHFRRLSNPEPWADRIERCQRALGDRREAVLVQLHPDLHRDDARLEHFLDVVPDWVRVAVEMRHPSWHDPHVYEILERHRAAYVVISGPGQEVAYTDRGEGRYAAEVLSDGFETQPAEDGSWTLPGVVSRKKQFIPAMMSAYQEL